MNQADDIDAAVRDALDAEVAGVDADDQLLARIRERVEATPTAGGANNRLILAAAAVLLVVVGAVSVAVLGDDDDGTSVVAGPADVEVSGPPVTELIEGIPVLAGATKGAGTPLGDGFEVAEGSVLLGDVFPTAASALGSEQAPDERGWRVSLLVTGDARAVFDAYLRQATEEGMTIGGTNLAGLCSERSSERGFRCDAAATEGHSVNGRRLGLGLWRAEAEGDRPPMSHLSISYSETGEPPYPSADGESLSYEPGTGNPALPGNWPALPGVGDQYEFGPTMPEGRGQRVEEGTALLAHPILGGCGSSAVFRVDGDPMEVLRAVVRQRADESSKGAKIEKRSDDGATVFSITWLQGGGDYDAQVVVRPGEPTYMLIDHCTND